MNKEIRMMSDDEYNSLKEEIYEEFPGEMELFIAITYKKRINDALKIIENEGTLRADVEIKNIEEILRGVARENNKPTDN